MGNLRGHRRGLGRGLGWLGIIAVLSNVLAGALLHHAPAKAVGLVDDILGQLTICTSDGAKTAPHGGSPDPNPKSDHCASCTLLAGFALIVALVFAAIMFPPTFIPYRLRVGVRTLADHLSLGGIHSRAPPLSA